MGQAQACPHAVDILNVIRKGAAAVHRMAASTVAACSNSIALRGRDELRARSSSSGSGSEQCSGTSARALPVVVVVVDLI